MSPSILTLIFLLPSVHTHPSQNINQLLRIHSIKRLLVVHTVGHIYIYIYIYIYIIYIYINIYFAFSIVLLSLLFILVYSLLASSVFSCLHLLFLSIPVSFFLRPMVFFGFVFFGILLLFYFLHNDIP